MNELLTKASVRPLQEWNLKQHGKEDLIPLLNGDLTRETRQLQNHVCGVPGSWEREGRLMYAATTANVTSYANYSAEVLPKSKELLIL